MLHDIVLPEELDTPFSEFEKARGKLIDSAFRMLLTNGIDLPQIFFNISCDCGIAQEEHNKLLNYLQGLDWGWYGKALQEAYETKELTDFDWTSVEIGFRVNADLPKSALVQVTKESEPVLKIVATDPSTVKEIAARLPELAATAERAGIPGGRIQLFRQGEDGLKLVRSADASAEAYRAATQDTATMIAKFRELAAIPEEMEVELLLEPFPHFQLRIPPSPNAKRVYEQRHQLAAHAAACGIPRGHISIFALGEDGLVLLANVSDPAWASSQLEQKREE